MKKNKRTNPVGRCVLPLLMKSRREASRLRQLFIEQVNDTFNEKRRVKIEELESDYYSTLLEWVTDYIFIPELTNEELRAKIEEFRAYRLRKYDELLKEQNKLLCSKCKIS